MQRGRHDVGGAVLDAQTECREVVAITGTFCVAFAPDGRDASVPMVSRVLSGLALGSCLDAQHAAH